MAKIYLWYNDFLSKNQTTLNPAVSNYFRLKILGSKYDHTTKLRANLQDTNLHKLINFCPNYVYRLLTILLNIINMWL